jgi:hypothetical protein
MSVNRSLLAAVAALTCVMCFPGLVRAEGTTCANPTFLIADGRRIESAIPNGSTFWFVVTATTGRSYIMEVAATTNAFPQGPGSGGVAAFSDGGTCATTLTTRNITLVDPLGNVNTTTRLSYTATTPFPEFSVMNASGVTVNYSFRAVETTMFSPAWTTNGTFDTYWSFQNTTNATMCTPNPCVLTLFDATGVVVQTVNIMSILSGGIFGTNTSTLGVTRNKVGNVRFTHDGPPGAILVKGNQANFASSPPFIELVPFEAVRVPR